jgi:hypothetical protein
VRVNFAVVLDLRPAARTKPHKLTDEPPRPSGHEQQATVRAFVAEGQYGALRSMRSGIQFTMPTRTAIDAGLRWGESSSMPRDIGCRPLGGMVAALYEVIGAGFDYPRHDPVADFARFGVLTRDESLLAGYRGAGGHVSFNAATWLRLTLHRIYPYLFMLIEGVLRSPPPPSMTGARACS